MREKQGNSRVEREAVSARSLRAGRSEPASDYPEMPGDVNSVTKLSDGRLCAPIVTLPWTAKETLLDELRDNHASKRQVREQVAAPHPARLLDDPVKPLKARSLHPTGRPAHDPGNHVKCPANTHYEINPQCRAPAGNEFLLPWRRDRHEQETRAGTTNRIDDRLLVIPEIPVVEASYTQGRMGRLKSPSDFGHNRWRRTQQENRISPNCRSLDQAGKQVDSCHALTQFKTQKAAAKDDAHSVNIDDVAPFHGAPKLGVALHLDELRYVHHHMLGQFVSSHPLINEIDRFVDRAHIERRAHETDPAHESADQVG